MQTPKNDRKPERKTTPILSKDDDDNESTASLLNLDFKSIDEMDPSLGRNFLV